MAGKNNGDRGFDDFINDNGALIGAIMGIVFVICVVVSFVQSIF